MSKLSFASQQHALAQIRQFIDEQRPGEALQIIAQTGTGTTELRNAYGVCLIRTGEFEKAIDVYRGLCTFEGVVLKPDALPVHLANYATALLLKRNINGCLDVLSNLSGSTDAAVVRLREAIERWRQSLTWWQRLRLRIGAFQLNGEPFDLGYPPGEVA